MSDHHLCSDLSEPTIDRRHALLAPVMAAFSVYAFVREARAMDGPSDRRLSARRWIDRQEALARGLRSGSVSPRAWHDEVNRLARDLDLDQFMAELKTSRSAPAGAPFMRDPVKRDIGFVDEQGQPRRLTYAAATFSFGPENVITPHAHKHMASAHMVIEGRVRIRTFDRIADQDGALLIRPTGDQVRGVGEAAAMTTPVDNVHWFTPASPRATTFDVIVSDLDPGQKSYEIQPVDPLGGEPQADGTILAPIMSFEAAMQRYSAHI